MAESQKGASSSVNSKEKDSLLDVEIGKDFLSSWKSMSVAENDAMYVDLDTATKGKQKTFNFDKLLDSFGFDQNIMKDLDPISENCPSKSVTHDNFPPKFATVGNLVASQGTRTSSEKTSSTRTREKDQENHRSDKTISPELYVLEKIHDLSIQSASGYESIPDTGSELEGDVSFLVIKMSTSSDGEQNINGILVAGLGSKHEKLQLENPPPQHMASSLSDNGERNSCGSNDHAPTGSTVDIEPAEADSFFEDTSFTCVSRESLQDSVTNREKQNSTSKLLLAPLSCGAMVNNIISVKEDETGVIQSKFFKKSDETKSLPLQVSSTQTKCTSFGSKRFGVQLIPMDERSGTTVSNVISVKEESSGMWSKFFKSDEYEQAFKIHQLEMTGSVALDSRDQVVTGIHQPMPPNIPPTVAFFNQRVISELFLFSSSPDMPHSTLFFVRSLHHGQVPVDLRPFRIVGHAVESGWVLLVSGNEVRLFNGFQLTHLPDLPPIAFEDDGVLVTVGCFVFDFDEDEINVMILRFQALRFFVYRLRTNSEVWLTDMVPASHQPEGFCYNNRCFYWADRTYREINIIHLWQDLSRFTHTSSYLPLLISARVICGVCLLDSSLQLVVLVRNVYRVYHVTFEFGGDGDEEEEMEEDEDEDEEEEENEGDGDEEDEIIAVAEIEEGWHLSGYNYYMTKGGWNGIRIPTDVGDEGNRMYIASKDGRFCWEVSMIKVEEGLVQQQKSWIYRANNWSNRAVSVWFDCDIGRFLALAPGVFN